MAMQSVRPTLNQLEMLVAVADAGGFGRAAALLGCSQSRISHAVTGLEETVGARLLDRSRRGCVPTHAGVRVIAKARKMMELAEELACEDARPALAGVVRIACFRSVATHLLPHALQSLTRTFPRLRVELDDSHEERDAVVSAVLGGRADIGIAQRPVPAELVAHPYVSDAYVLVVPASLSALPPLAWHDLAGLPYIQLGCAGALDVLAQCRKAGFDAHASRTLANDTSIVAMVAHGMGYSILPHLAVFPATPGVRIAPLPIPAMRHFAIVTTPAKASARPVQTVSRMLLDSAVLARSAACASEVVTW